MTKSAVQILYDGDCPFCTSYVKMYRLQENFDCVLLNAREHPELVARFRDDGMEISEGFIVTLDGRSYHGVDALVILSSISSQSGFMNRVMAAVFRSKTLSALLYPIMKFGRAVTLRLLGRTAAI